MATDFVASLFRGIRASVSFEEELIFPAALIAVTT